jgi:hypothetical protein
MHKLVLIAALAAAALATSAAASAAPSHQQTLAHDLALAHDATAKYVDGLGRAKADGYQILTKMVPDMGYHFINPAVKGFDLRKPPILVYEHQGGAWRLGALEWVFPKKPATPPIPGARYGTFGAACHYKDGTVVFADSQVKCAETAPGSGAAFTIWHGPLITLHVWLWYPNPLGMFSGVNPFARPFNHG